MFYFIAAAFGQTVPVATPTEKLCAITVHVRNVELLPEEMFIWSVKEPGHTFPEFRFLNIDPLGNSNDLWFGSDGWGVQTISATRGEKKFMYAWTGGARTLTVEFEGVVNGVVTIHDGLWFNFKDCGG